MADFFGAIAAGEIGSKRLPLVFPEPTPKNGILFPLQYNKEEKPLSVYKKLVVYDLDLVARQSDDTLDQQLVQPGFLVFQIALENDDVASFRGFASVGLTVHDHIIIRMERVLHRRLLNDRRSYEIQNGGREQDSDNDVNEKALEKAACFVHFFFFLFSVLAAAGVCLFQNLSP
jgi:hypothetical protein